MSRRTLTRMLAFFLLINTVLYTVLPAGASYCLGETCGITFWHCCCESTPSYVGKCAVHAGAGSTNSGAISTTIGGDCNCAMVTTISPAVEVATASLATSYKPVIFLATPPVPVAAYAPLDPIEGGFSRNETRGPPPRRVVRSSNSLRAPPAA